MDTELYKHIVEITRFYTSDGAPAALKAGRVLAQRFPNLTLLQRDTCHAIRLAAQKPQKAESAWAAVHVLKHLDKEQPLLHALKHLSYAPQRWNSESEPLRRFAGMLIPIALLLAVQASDTRQSTTFRQRSQRALEALTPTFLADVALSSDFSSEMVRFLRSFDVDLHDPASTVRQKQEFIQRTGLTKESSLLLLCAVCPFFLFADNEFQNVFVQCAMHACQCLTACKDEDFVCPMPHLERRARRPNDHEGDR
ncbi:unnamed protein product [Effrenium voratum]|nr:unnamed protein product [Effrenium voratum]